MKSTLLRAVTLAVVGAVTTVLAACGSQSNAEPGDTIRIGTLGDAPPNVYQLNGDYTGFDNELLKAAATKVGLKHEFVGTDFSALLGQVANGTFDVGSSAIAQTEERRRTVDFTDAYNFEVSSILTKEGSPVTDEQTLGGRRVAVIQAAVPDMYVTKQVPQAQVVRFPSYDSAFAALRNGGVDAWVIDLTIAKKYATENPNDRLKIAKPITMDVPHGFAVRKGNEALRTKLNEGLRQVVADGTWQRLHDQFIPDAPVPAQFRPTG